MSAQEQCFPVLFFSTLLLGLLPELLKLWGGKCCCGCVFGGAARRSCPRLVVPPLSVLSRPRFMEQAVMCSTLCPCTTSPWGPHKTPLVPWSFSESLVKSASGEILAAASLRGSVICLSLWAGRRGIRSSFPRLCPQELTHKTMSTPSLPPPNYSEEVTQYFAKVRTDFLSTLF